MQKIICLILIVALATSASAGYYGGIASPYGYGMGLGMGLGMGYGMGFGGLGYGLGGYGLGFGMPGLGYGGLMGMPMYNPLMMGGLAGGKYY